MARTIAFAVLSGCLLLGCGDAGVEHTEQLGQAITILTSSSLPVKSFVYSSYGLMSYLLTPPAIPLLYLGAISVQRISGTGVVTGHITPGTVNKPGRANLQVSPDIYDSLLAASVSAEPHFVDLSYDDLTLVPVTMTVR